MVEEKEAATDLKRRQRHDRGEKEADALEDGGEGRTADDILERGPIDILDGIGVASWVLGSPSATYQRSRIDNVAGRHVDFKDLDCNVKGYLYFVEKGSNARPDQVRRQDFRLQHPLPEHVGLGTRIRVTRVFSRAFALQITLFHHIRREYPQTDPDEAVRNEYVRCFPEALGKQFHGRYFQNYVLVRLTGPNPFRFAEILAFFSLQYANQTFEVALVNFFKETAIDKETRLTRLEREYRSVYPGQPFELRTEIISIQSILMVADIVPLSGSPPSGDPQSRYPKYYVWNRFVDVREWLAWWLIELKRKKIDLSVASF